MRMCHERRHTSGSCLGSTAAAGGVWPSVESFELGIRWDRDDALPPRGRRRNRALTRALVLLLLPRATRWHTPSCGDAVMKGRLGVLFALCGATAWTACG